MRRQGYRRTGVTNEKGYTLIFAVIIMAVMTIIGGAVLTSAANSLNAVNKRVDGRQAYYIAKSVLNSIDASLRDGDSGIGGPIRERMYQTALANQSNNKDKEETVTVSAEIKLTDSLSKYTVSNLNLSYKAPYMWKRGNPVNNVQAYNLRVNDIAINYDVQSGDNKFRMTAYYDFFGVVRSGKGDAGNNWSDVVWNITRIDQN